MKAIINFNKTLNLSFKEVENFLQGTTDITDSISGSYDDELLNFTKEKANKIGFDEQEWLSINHGDVAAIAIANGLSGNAEVIWFFPYYETNEQGEYKFKGVNVRLDMDTTRGAIAGRILPTLQKIGFTHSDLDDCEIFNFKSNSPVDMKWYETKGDFIARKWNYLNREEKENVLKSVWDVDDYISSAYLKQIMDANDWEDVDTVLCNSNPNWARVAAYGNENFKEVLIEYLKEEARHRLTMENIFSNCFNKTLEKSLDVPENSNNKLQM